MPRKPITDAQRADRTYARSQALTEALNRTRDAGLSPAERQEAWLSVATLAGNIQRDTRQLAGLGRGG